VKATARTKRNEEKGDGSLDGRTVLVGGGRVEFMTAILELTGERVRSKANAKYLSVSTKAAVGM